MSMDRATESVKVLLTAGEKAQVEHDAALAGMTMSNYFRRAITMPPLQRGGAMPGSGRPKKADQSQQDQSPQAQA